MPTERSGRYKNTMQGECLRFQVSGPTGGQSTYLYIGIKDPPMGVLRLHGIQENFLSCSSDFFFFPDQVGGYCYK